MKKIKIRKALISVYDKSKLLNLAIFLKKNDVEIISTGKTYDLLKSNNIESTSVAEYTGFPEILGGRVKTLHPKIFGGILGIENDFSHIKDKKDNDIAAIDLVVVNLYPFSDVASAQSSAEDEIIENIDIGGVSLIRAAAKNFYHVCVLTSPNQYESLSIEPNLHYRRLMAKAAFAITAHYESAIYNWFCERDVLNNNLMNISLKKLLNFRYGENPHQKSSFYGSDNLPFMQLQGKEISYNNILDLDVGALIVQQFAEPTIAIIKHNNPCGVATSSTAVEAYKRALKCDPVSSFGGVITVNHKITKELALEVIKIFTEVLAAPEIDEDAKDILATKPNMRVIIFNKYTNRHNVKSALGGMLLQEENDTILLNNDHYDIVTEIKPSKKEIEQMIFAWKICKYVKSNAIVIVKDFKTISIGAGQTSRIESVRIALEKAGKNAAGSVLASDGFFPFTDSIEASFASGITGIIEPGGSIKDNEIIKKSEECKIPLLFTRVRHFRH